MRSNTITFHHILLLLMLSFGLKLPRVIVFVVYAVEHSGSFYIFEMIVAQQITKIGLMLNFHESTFITKRMKIS